MRTITTSTLKCVPPEYALNQLMAGVLPEADAVSALDQLKETYPGLAFRGAQHIVTWVSDVFYPKQLIALAKQLMASPQFVKA